MAIDTKSPPKTRQHDETAFDTPSNLEAIQGLEPKRALSLSLVPGLGQLYNGEKGKGLLFLAVTVANGALLGLLFFTAPILNSLVHFSSSFFHTAPENQVLQHTLDIVRSGRSVTFTYFALILSYALYAARDAYDRAVDKRRGKTLPSYAFTMPEATSGSYLFHFSIICALILMVVFFCAPEKPQKQVTDITLIQENVPPPPKKSEPPKPKSTPKVELKKEVEPPKPQKPPEQKPVEPPKPTPVAIAVPSTKAADPVVQSNEPAPAATAPAAAPAETGSSSAGSPSGSPGQEASGDGDDFDFGNYMSEIQKRIKKNWHPPRGAESQTITVKFQIRKDGSVGFIKMFRSSGVSAADDAAKEAITNAAPFAPLPPGAGESIDIKFTFDYAVFSGKMAGQ